MSFRVSHDDPIRPRFVSKYTRCDPCLDEIRRKKEEARFQADDHPKNPHFLSRYRQHRERIECIGSKVDSSSPTVPSADYYDVAKYNQRLKDYVKIESENVKMLRNIALVLSGSNRKPFSRSEMKIKKGQAQNRQLVETELAFQNLQIYRRINEAKPKYPTCDYLEWYKKEEDKMEKMSMYPLYWKSSCEPEPKPDVVEFHPERGDKIINGEIVKGSLKSDRPTWDTTNTTTYIPSVIPYKPNKRFDKPRNEVPRPVPRQKLKPAVPRAARYYYVPSRTDSNRYGMESKSAQHKSYIDYLYDSRKSIGESTSKPPSEPESPVDEEDKKPQRVEQKPLSRDEIDDIVEMTRPSQYEEYAKTGINLSGTSINTGPVITGDNLAISAQDPNKISSRQASRKPSKTKNENEPESESESEKNVPDKSVKSKVAFKDGDKGKSQDPKTQEVGAKGLQKTARKYSGSANQYKRRQSVLPPSQGKQSFAQQSKRRQSMMPTPSSKDQRRQSVMPSNAPQRRKSMMPPKSDVNEEKDVENEGKFDGNDEKVNESPEKAGENDKVDDSQAKKSTPKKSKGSLGKKSKSRASDKGKKSLKKSTGKVGANSLDGISKKESTEKSAKGSKSSKKSRTSKKSLKKASSTVDDPDIGQARSALRASYSQVEKEKLQKESEEKMKNKKKASNTSQTKGKNSSSTSQTKGDKKASSSSTSQNKSKTGKSKSSLKPESKTDPDVSGFEFANSDIMKSTSVKKVPSNVPEPEESLGVESTIVEEHRADDPDDLKIVSSHQGKRFAASDSDTHKKSSATSPSNNDSKPLGQDPKS